MSPQLLYSCCYFIICLSNGITLAFFPLYASSLGFNALQIAAVSAAANIATLVGAPGFTSLSFYHFSPRKILFVNSLLACLIYLPLLFLSSFSCVFVVWFLYLVLNAGSSVMIDTRAIREATNQQINFEHARTWGSIGFVLSIALVGLLIDQFGLHVIIKVGFVFVCATHGLSYLVMPRLAATPGQEFETRSTSTPEAGYARPLYWVFVAVALSWASHSAYYVYFSIYLRSLSWSGFAISLAWNTGVVAEIILFRYFRRITTHMSLTTILRLSALLSVLRWGILTSSADPLVLVLAQVLHAFSFGSLYLSSIRLVQLVCPPEFRDRGQGLLSGFGNGGGSLLGRVTFGCLASRLGPAENYYLLFWPAALLAALGASASYIFRRPDADKTGKLG